MSFVIVTGMSGAGKSTALKMLEDAGFFCADNLPLPLVDKFAQLSSASSSDYAGIALGIDVRTLKDAQASKRLLEELKTGGYQYQILYLEANDGCLIRRYKETRRNHPLTKGGRIEEGIDQERDIVRPFRDKCDYVIDTSLMKTRELRAELGRIFADKKIGRSLYITVLSFGFKYGIPEDADLVFDVRFLPNPYYIPELKNGTGMDPAVRNYVYTGILAEEFEKRWFTLIDFLLPCYVAEGKTQLVIAVGCTGGRHRSVAMAESLAAHLSDMETYAVAKEHRDIER